MKQPVGDNLGVVLLRVVDQCDNGRQMIGKVHSTSTSTTIPYHHMMHITTTPTHTHYTHHIPYVAGQYWRVYFFEQTSRPLLYLNSVTNYVCLYSTIAHSKSQ